MNNSYRVGLLDLVRNGKSEDNETSRRKVGRKLMVIVAFIYLIDVGISFLSLAGFNGFL